jgi:subtilisin family serine protease
MVAATKPGDPLPTFVRRFDVVSNVFPLTKSGGPVTNALHPSLPLPSFVLAGDGTVVGPAALEGSPPAGPYRYMLTLPLLNAARSGASDFLSLDAAVLGIVSLSTTPVVSPDLSFTVPEVKGTAADILPIGATPLKGTGVIVGIIDYGFDFAHPNFLKPDGTTRLIALWDQNSVGATDTFKTVLDDLKPTSGWNAADAYVNSYIYSPSGQFTSSPGKTSPGAAEKALNVAITSANPYADYDPHKNYFTGEAGQSAIADAHGAHGTHVADIAAGNGAATGRPGLAPDADIIFVQLRTPNSPDGPPDTATILDAVHFIACYAEKNTKHAVINLSVNANAGLHDDTDTTVQMLDKYALGTSGSGVTQSAPIVISAGNQFVLAREPQKLAKDPLAASNSWGKKYRECLAQRLDMAVPADGDVFHWFIRRKKGTANNTRPAALEIWFQTPANADNVTVEVSSRGGTGDRLITTVSQAAPGLATVDIKNRANAVTVGKIDARGAVPATAGPRKIRIEIADPTTLTWSGDNFGTLTVKVTSTVAGQRAHVFVERAGINHPFQSSLLVKADSAKGDVPDDDLATRIGRASSLGILSCGTSIIAVGAYFAPDRSGAKAQIAEFSSAGPPVKYTSLDTPTPEAGAIEQPWISAPGAIVLAARSKGGRLETPPIDMAVVMSGTSMAAPHVTGTIALMLQKTPAASTTAIRNALRDAARHPYTGFAGVAERWHKRFGHGRLNAQAAVEKI